MKKMLRSLAEETRAFRVVEDELASRNPDDISVVLAPVQGGEPVHLVVRILQRIFPADTMALAVRMGSTKGTGTPLLACPAISPRVAELCRDLGIGTLDAAGNCRIPAPGLYIQIAGKENLHPDTRPAVDVFAPRSSRIIRLLLAEPQRGFKVQELAKEAGVSIGLASKVKQTLLDEAFIEERKRLLIVPHPFRLLQEWVAAGDSLHAEEVVMNVAISAENAEQRLAAVCDRLGVQYGLTGLSGYRRLQLPAYGSQATAYYSRRASVCVAGRVEELLEKLRWKAGPPANTAMTIWTPREESVFWGSQSIDDLNVVSPLQLFLDLHLEKGCQEMAEQVLEERISPAWSASGSEREDR